MSFDIEPDAPIHGECAAEIKRLEAEIKRWKEMITTNIMHVRIAELEDAVLEAKELCDLIVGSPSNTITEGKIDSLALSLGHRACVMRAKRTDGTHNG